MIKPILFRFVTTLSAVCLFLTVLTIFICLVITASSASSLPCVSLHKFVDNTADNEIEIHVRITNISEAEIKGYSLRLDYNPIMLSNPRAVTAGTLSGNPDVFFQTPLGQYPPDGIGKFSIGTLFDSTLIQHENDILIKIIFEILPEFNCLNSYVIFVNTTKPDSKTNLFDEGYNEIDSVFINHVPGDFDSSGTVNLADAVMGLQIMAGTMFETSLHLSTDINCDNHIGMEDVIYILQNQSEIR